MNIHFYTARIFTGIKIKFIWCADGEFDKLVTEGGINREACDGRGRSLMRISTLIPNEEIRSNHGRRLIVVAHMRGV